jgi:hypothetical protein
LLSDLPIHFLYLLGIRRPLLLQGLLIDAIGSLNCSLVMWLGILYTLLSHRRMGLLQMIVRVVK